MMKKMLFLMLFLMFLGAANVSSQVRIGGNEKPNDAAVLDLNVDNNTNTGTKGLALPRVSLSDKTAKLDGVTDNIKGMLVYNTGGSLAEGVYYWNGGTWVNTPGSYILGSDSLIGLDNAKTGDVLQYNGTDWRPGPGWETTSWTVTCAACASKNSADGTYVDITFTTPARCTIERMWIPAIAFAAAWNAELKLSYVRFHRINNLWQNNATSAIVTCLRPTR